MTFQNLVSGINTVNKCLRESAACAINQHVTARNWLIGFYIVNYEQNGLDRAQYGESLIAKSSSKSFFVPEDKLFNRLSYTHLLQLLPI